MPAGLCLPDSNGPRGRDTDSSAGVSGWDIETVTSGLEQLENLEPDGGGFYVSGDAKVYHVDGSGKARTVLENLAAPGGLQLDGPISLCPHPHRRQAVAAGYRNR